MKTKELIMLLQSLDKYGDAVVTMSLSVPMVGDDYIEGTITGSSVAYGDFPVCFGPVRLVLKGDGR